MRKVTFAAHKKQKRAPLLWCVASFLPQRSPKLALRWTHHRSSGAEVFIPWSESSAQLAPPVCGTRLLLIRVGIQPWQRWKAPIVVERGLTAIPVYIIALSWQGIDRRIVIVSSRQTPRRWEDTTLRLSESHKSSLHEATGRWRAFVNQVTTMNRNISSIVLRRSNRLQVYTPRIRLSHRDLPSLSYRFRRRVALSPISATTGDHDV